MSGQCLRWFDSRQQLLPDIYNGRRAQSGEFPYIVLIVAWDISPEDNETYWQKGTCTGSILNEHWFVTAAHCFELDCEQLDDGICIYTIHPGIIDRHDLGMDYGLENLIIHENYTLMNRTVTMDIALVKVNQRMNFTGNIVGGNDGHYRQLNSICLPAEPTIDGHIRDDDNDHYEYGLMAGFGVTADGNIADSLQTGWTRIPPLQQQQSVDSQLIVIPSQYPFHGGTYPCYGDSGGPLVQYVDGRAVLIGISVSVFGKFIGETCQTINASESVAFLNSICNVVIASDLQIGNYPNLTDTTNQCGVGRQSTLMSGQCLRWFDSSQQLLPDIYNGRRAQSGEFPYIVLIVAWDISPDDNESFYQKGTCTGSILNEHWIVTAAHCFEVVCDYENGCAYTIHPGIIDRHDSVDLDMDYGYDNIIIHELYMEMNRSDTVDIALVRVNRTMNFTANIIGNGGDGNGGHYRQLNSICLPAAPIGGHIIDNNDDHYEYGLMAGFGVTLDGRVADSLQTGWTRIPTRHQQQQLSAESDQLIIIPSQYPFPGGSYICFGDSGGPLVQYVNGRAVLIGISVSVFGNIQVPVTCSTINSTKPVGFKYIRVTEKLDWILTEILDEK
ncbi:uncharacterized protein LOC128959057 [Oppia nitens]|uniref:uncharacterized protein LOC128959057 n=1 Tax=Oppia nitens TaxID=1686743 RepID=UPI0023DCC42A|nr:uncharacterized protein LOC128959057 [Oppia nitens]